MSRARIVPGWPAIISAGSEDRGTILAISDVHIGFEDQFARAAGGINISGADAAKSVIRDVVSLLRNTTPDTLVLLGDTKSGTGRITPHEWEQVPAFLDAACAACDDVILVPGNHDGAIQRLVPDGVTMTGPAGMLAGGVLYTHGHAMPPDSFSHADEIIMGHMHPVFSRRDSVMDGQRVWVSAMVRKSAIFPSRGGEIAVTIMPSFNRHLRPARGAGRRTRRERDGGSSDTNNRPGSPIIERMMPVQRAVITTLDGTIIGDESMIDSVLG